MGRQMTKGFIYHWQVQLLIVMLVQYITMKNKGCIYLLFIKAMCFFHLLYPNVHHGEEKSLIAEVGYSGKLMVLTYFVFKKWFISFSFHNKVSVLL